MDMDDVLVVANPDSNGVAIGTLYRDAYEGHGHARGEYARHSLVVQGDRSKVNVRLESGRAKVLRTKLVVLPKS
jgi:hypothetical protein